MFLKNGMLVVVERGIIDGHIEPSILYIDRCRFIISQKIETNEKYKEIEKLSYIYVNMKHYNCKYSESLMNKVNLLQENISYE
jgi:hypothetical protein